MSDQKNFTFSHPELTPLATDGSTPTYATLALLHMELNTNAMSIASRRGGGKDGLLSLTITPLEYTAFSTTPFVPPTCPSEHPVHADGATGPTIVENNRKHKLLVDEFTIYVEAEKTLKQQLLAAVPSTFINELRDKKYAFARKTTLELLTHLDLTYGTVTPDDLQKNLQDLHRDWSTDSPIEDLWAQLNTCCTFAEDHDKISDATAIRAAILNFERSGVFADAIKDWRRLDPTLHTLARLKSDFNFANKERQRNLTTRDAGFAGNAREPPTRPDNSREPPTRPDTSRRSNMHYCWSHGLGTDRRHTSAQCQNKAPGHRNEATVSYMLGGCNTIQRRRGETVIFVPPPPTDTGN
jgi:hypothetical protein